MAEFQLLGVQPWLVKQCDYMALRTPTPIQQKCIPAILKGRHIVGGAATGSGKTAAFALPILQTLAADTYGVYALILTPSRELAYQIIDQFIALGAPLQVRTTLAIGGVATEAQLDALKARPHIVAATPGRLRHLLQTFGQEILKAFANLRYLVLDEADRLTEGDIQKDVRVVLRLLPAAKRQRQVLMFTATVHPRLIDFSPPKMQEEGEEEEETEEPLNVLAEVGITDRSTLDVVLVDGVLNESTAAGASHSSFCHITEGDTGHSETNPSSHIADALSAPVYHLPPTLTQSYIFIPNMVKLPHLVAALRGEGKTQLTIVYVNSCLRAELVRLTLQLLGFPVCSLDSLLTQQHRLDNVASFKLGISRILVCTDIAARGLDIPNVGLVLHYDVPKHADTYVHRVGRTARAGRAGRSVALVTEYDVSLVQRIEKKTRSRLALWDSPAASEKAVLPLLDEVSAAKVQAKQQVTEQFGDRVQTNKSYAAEKKGERAAAVVVAQARRRARIQAASVSAAVAAEEAEKKRKFATAAEVVGSSEAQPGASSPRPAGDVTRQRVPMSETRVSAMERTVSAAAAPIKKMKKTTRGRELAAPMTTGIAVSPARKKAKK